MRSYVRLLPASTGTVTAKLLRLCSPGVRDKEGPVVRNQLLLELEGARGVEVLRVVGNDSLRNRLADGIHLRGVSTTLHAKTDVNRRKSILASDKDGLVDLEPQDLRLEERDGGAVDVDETPAFLRVRNGSRGLFYGCKIGKCTGRGGANEKTWEQWNEPSFCRTSERPAS